MAGSETYMYIPACSNACLCLPLHYVVPAILKDAIKVTSENIEKELENTLKMVFQFTGTLYMYVQLMHIHTVLHHTCTCKLERTFLVKLLLINHKFEIETLGISKKC